MDDLQTILADARSIAVVGCSDDPGRTSHRIAQYLLGEGFRVIPVNPNHDRVLGLPCYDSVEDIPLKEEIDIVCIFRHPQFTADMVRSAVRRAETTETKPVIWTQIGVSSQEAEQLARDADLPYVRNRCIMVEHARMTV